MKNNKLFREYSINEWNDLTFENKRKIWNHYWDPFDQEIGITTRQNIIKSFKSLFPNLHKIAIEIGFGYFGFYVGMIYVIVAKTAIRVPNNFADISINKGILISRNSSKEIIVSWRDCGGSNATFHLNDTKYHTI